MKLCTRLGQQLYIVLLIDRLVFSSSRPDALQGNLLVKRYQSQNNAPNTRSN